MIDEFDNLSLPNAQERVRAMPPMLREPWLAAAAFAVVLFGALWFTSAIQPTSAEFLEKEFHISPGEGFAAIAERLEASGIVRSRAAFVILAVATGSARELKAGSYLIALNKSTREILGDLVSGSVREIEVTIPPGATVYEIDHILAERGVTDAGELIAQVHLMSSLVEGYLFPDTYRFFSGTEPAEVIRRMRENFAAKTEELFAGVDAAKKEQAIVLASLLEREVPQFNDRTVVAGVLLKRIAADMPLQVDATVCYTKEMKADRAVDCLPLTALDLKDSSPYNTYLHVGWPPGPIGNPGFEAIQAALHPEKSPYWFYLSDPVTHNTIFSRTLEEHAKNRNIYLQ